MLKDNTFLDSIVEWIFFVLVYENEGNMSKFRTLIENTDSAIIFFLKENCYFPGSEPPKLHGNSTFKRIEK